MTTPAESHPAQSSDPLDVMRDQIDGLDAQILALVAQRTSLTVAIAGEKHRRGIDTMVPGRHSEVIANYMDGVPEDSPMTRAHAVELGETVMRISRGAQQTHRAKMGAKDLADRAELSDLATQAALRQQQQ